MKNKIYLLFLFFFLINLAGAVVWSPQGDISLKNRYYITNDPIGNCSDGYFVSGKLANGSWKCSISFDTHIKGDDIYLYNDSDTMYLNETKLNKTIDLRDTNCSVDGSCPNVIYESEEANLNVNSSVFSNETTWWASLNNWVGGWFYNNGNSLDFNETKLNETIDAREIVSNETDLIVWINDSSNTYVKSSYPQNVSFTGNLSLGDKITFALGGVIDNLISGWLRVNGNLNVTGNTTVQGDSLKVNGEEVCLEDGTNCPAGIINTEKNTTGFYLYNDSSTIYFNETQLNSTIDERDTNCSIDGSCPNVIYESEESNLNVNSSIYSNQTTWWSDLTGFVSSWFYNNAGNLDFNESKLNDTIDSRDTNTEKNTTGIYLYNDTTTIYLNETKLNRTIDLRENDTLYYAGEIYINKNASNYFILNETQLNSTIDSRDTQKTTTGFYLYNDTSIIYFNETQLNNTIDSKISNETDSIVWTNDSSQVYIKNGFPIQINISDVLFVNGTNESVGIGKINPIGKLNIFDEEEDVYLVMQGNTNKSSIIQMRSGNDTINKVWQYLVGEDGSLNFSYGSNLSGVSGNMNTILVLEPNISIVRQTSVDSDSRFILEADTDGDNNHENPFFELKQDAGVTKSFLSLEGTANLTFPLTLEDAFLIGHTNNKAIQFFTNKIIRMTLSNNGNVGIGTNNPQSKLDVIGNGSFTGNVYANDLIGNLSWNNLTDYPVECPPNTAIIQLNDSVICADINYWNESGTLASYSGNVSIGGDLNVTGNTKIQGNFLQTSGDPIHAGSIVNGTDGAKLLQASAVYISDRYAYVTAYSDNALEIVDVSNPTNPTHVGSITNGTDGALLVSPNSVYVAGKYAYVSASNSDALEIVDISNPSNPTHAGKIVHGGDVLLDSPSAVYVSGRYAYVTTYNSNALEIVDISNPTNPIHTGSITNGDGGAVLTNANGLYVSGKYAYVCSTGGNALEIIDISNPINPIHAGNFSGISGAWNVYVSGRYAYVTALNVDTLYIIDISNASNPVEVGNISHGGDVLLDQPRSVRVSGKYAYVTAYNSNALEIIDISNASNPIHAGSIINGGDVLLNNPTYVYVSGKYAYVTSWSSNSLEIVEIIGIDSPSANIGDLAVGSLDVWDNVNIFNDLSVGSGLVIGGGILSQGTFGFGNGKFIMNALGYLGINIQNSTALLDIGSSTTDRASMRIRNGTAPATPNIGDMWVESTDNGKLFYQRNINDVLDISNQPKNIVYINSFNDLLPLYNSGTGDIELENDTKYIFPGADVNINIPFPIEFGKDSIITEARITTAQPIKQTSNDGEMQIRNTVIIYAGNDTLFLIPDNGVVSRFVEVNIAVFNIYGKGTIFNISNEVGEDSILVLNTFGILRPSPFLPGAESLGTIDNVLATFFNCQFSDFQKGLTFTDSINLNLGTIQIGTIYNDTTFFNFSGTSHGQIQLNGVGALINNETQHIFNFDNTTNFQSVVVSFSPIFLSGSATAENIFEDGSFDQTSIKFKFTGNTNIPDSTAIGQADINGTLTRTGLVIGEHFVIISSSGNDGWGLSPLVIWEFSNGGDEDVSERFAINETLGRLVYIGLEETVIDLDASIRIQQAVSTVMRIKFFKNGIGINKTLGETNILSGVSTTIETAPRKIKMETNDYIDLRIESENSIGGRAVVLESAGQSVHRI